MKGEAIASAQGIPPRFLESILAELRRSGIIGSQRGSDGGYWLARPAGAISVADVIRAVEGPLADVHGAPPEEVVYGGAATELQRVWIATRVALREVLEVTSVADIASGRLPSSVAALAERPDGWARR
jgi:Rrf2 family protein